MRIYIYLLLIFISKITVGQDSVEYVNEYFPMEMKDSRIYIEKFTPIYTHDLVEFDLENISERSDLIELLRLYNEHIYRGINNETYNTIVELEAEEHIIPIYLRDFEETTDTTVRFIVKNDFSIVDVFDKMLNSSYSYYSSSNNITEYYIYDREKNIRYYSFYDSDEMLQMLDLFYEYSTEKSNPTRAEFEKLWNKRKSKLNRGGGGSTALFWLTYIGICALVPVISNLLQM